MRAPTRSHTVGLNTLVMCPGKQDLERQKAAKSYGSPKIFYFNGGFFKLFVSLLVRDGLLSNEFYGSLNEFQTFL